MCDKEIKPTQLTYERHSFLDFEFLTDRLWTETQTVTRHMQVVLNGWEHEYALLYFKHSPCYGNRKRLRINAIIYFREPVLWSLLFFGYR